MVQCRQWEWPSQITILRPSGAGEAWIESFSQNSRQVYATNPSSRAILPLAVIPEAARLGDLGVRLLLRPNDHVQNAARVLRDRSRQAASSPRARNGTPRGRLSKWSNAALGIASRHDFSFMTATAVRAPKVLAEYVGYFNDWRPHRSPGQRAPCAPGAGASHRSAARSSRYLCSEAITFISKPHDDDGSNSCALQE